MSALVLKTGDIITMRHLDNFNNKTMHPFLIVNSNIFHFEALQVTSAKFHPFTKKEIISEWLQNKITHSIYFQVGRRDGFEFLSYIFLDEKYKVKFGDNNFKIKKVGEIKSPGLFKKIVNQC